MNDGTPDSTSTYTLDYELPDNQSTRLVIGGHELLALQAYLGSGSGSPRVEPFTGYGFGYGTDESFSSNDLAEGIWENGAGNVALIWDNIALSMTVQMRITSGDRALGTAWASEPYVHVRWLFLLLPTAMVLLALVFVILTGWRSRARRLPNWGSNCLPDIAYADRLELESSAEDAKAIISEPANSLLQVSALEHWAEGLTAKIQLKSKENDIQDGTALG